MSPGGRSNCASLRRFAWLGEPPQYATIALYDVAPSASDSSLGAGCVGV